MIFTVSYGAYLPKAIDRGTAFQFSENKKATPVWKVLSFKCNRSPKRIQLSLIVGIAFGFWLISDLTISGWSRFPHFQFSVFPVSTFPVYVSTCIWPCRTGWIEGLFQVVALKSQFSDPKWNLPSWFSGTRANFHLWTVVLHSYLARNVTQFHLFWASDCWHGIQSTATQGLEYGSIYESVPEMN